VDEPRREPDDRPQRPVYNDLRDDYDDDFGIIRTPAEIARRKVFIPATAIIAIGIVGILALTGLSIGIAIEQLRKNPVWLLVIYLSLTSLGACLFCFVIVGGLSMARLRNYRIALNAAYIVAGLSIAGCYTILFYPFGIWALILLYREDIRREFQPSTPLRND